MVEDNGMWNPHCVYIIYESKRWEPFLGLFGGKMPIFVLQMIFLQKKKGERLKQAIWDGEGVFRGRFGKRLNFAPFPMDDG